MSKLINQHFLMQTRRLTLQVFAGVVSVGLLPVLSMAAEPGTPAPAPQAAAAVSSPTQDAMPTKFMSDGSQVRIDRDRAAITPIAGWEVEPGAMGMSLVMKEKIQSAVELAGKTGAETKTIDYGKPIFARNITVMSMNQPSPIDAKRAEEFKQEFTKKIQQGNIMSDFQFTSHDFFNYRSEKDGLVFFAQHTANGFPMRQMMVLVSGEERQYLVTYTDLAESFSNQATYDAAWKSMTSIDAKGLAPVRYVKEAKTAGIFLVILALFVVPVLIVRYMNARRIRRMIRELDHEWDHASGESTMASDRSGSQLAATRVAAGGHGKAVRKAPAATLASGVSSLSAEFISSRHSRFRTDVSAFT